MGLFQKSVLSNHLSSISDDEVNNGWNKFQDYKNMSSKIRGFKEEAFQAGFLTKIFVDCLGYKSQYDSAEEGNLFFEEKNISDGKKADGAIKKEGEVVLVIELKGTNKKDLKSVETQAFGYKANHPKCKYIVTSNFEKLRFYIDNAVSFEEFDLFNLSKENYKLLHLCLHKDNVFNDTPEKLKNKSVFKEESVTKKLYNDYSGFRKEIFNSLIKSNTEYDKLLLFNKTQKLLDRFLFIFFAEDRGLVPANSISKIISKWEGDVAFGDSRSLYSIFKQYFHVLNVGRPAIGEHESVFAYNGGLFAKDEVLDKVEIVDSILLKHTKNLSHYDFESEISVNILGHIFEHSLSEIEEIQNEISGLETGTSKRKKDGVFYTPQYITKYIVENTVGKLCVERKTALAIIEADYFTDKKRQNKTIKPLVEKLKHYRDWLLQLTICDPACGSGAFLNEALNFLIAEHGYIDELQAKLFGDAMVLSDVENSILEHNLFGVDINEESVEIAKLSLWLRTAQPNRKLNNLNHNIKCGNSLIDDVTVAGDKAFHWEREFPTVFEKGGFDVVIGNPPYVQIQSMGEIANDLKNQNFKTFERTGDLYCLFYELGNIILKEKGLLGFITSNKWMRAKYGKSLRNYLINATQPLEIIDLGSGIFESATVDSNLLIFEKNNKTNRKPFSAIDLSKEKSFLDFTIYKGSKVGIKIESDENWIIYNPLEIKINKKIEDIGKPLKDWNIKINRGVLTGLNKAFIINEETKNKLIQEDVNNSDIIKPILRGRDVHRYNIDYANLYLINIHNGYKGVPRVEINNYPSIKAHLDKHEPKLSKRSDKGKTPYNLRNCAYVDEFEKEKLIYPETTVRRGEFFYDNSKLFIDKTCFCIVGKNLKYLNTILSSTLYTYYLENKLRLVGNITIQYSKQYLVDIPIIKPKKEEPFIEKAEQMLILNIGLQETSSKFQRALQRKLEGLENLPKKLENWYELAFTDFINELKKKKIALSLGEEAEWEDYFLVEQQKALAIKSQINQTDKEIDAMVYELYGLTIEEIEIVENS
jgi:type I restriction-modification system DNA methylase subunit